MKNTLFVFGCSYSSLFDFSGITTDYRDYLGKWPRHWSDILAENLNLELSNIAVGGNSNDGIFNDFCSKINDMNSGDVVIIGWTYLNRFKVVDTEKNKWINVSHGIELHDISKKTIDEIGVNRTHQLYEEELNNRENLIKQYLKLKNIKIFFWNAGFSIRNKNVYLLNKLKNNINDTFIDVIINNGGNRIFEETNGKIKDNHLGMVGNKVQSELFYNEIIENKF